MLEKYLIVLNYTVAYKCTRQHFLNFPLIGNLADRQGDIGQGREIFLAIMI